MVEEDEEGEKEEEDEEVSAAQTEAPCQIRHPATTP